jgi:cathepsin L
MALINILVIQVLVLAAVAAGRPAWDRLDGYTFAMYTRDFGKRYPASEAPARAALFARELAAVRRHNAAAGRSYNKGVNHLSDRSVAELARMNGFRPLSAAATAAMYAQEHVRRHSVEAGGAQPPLPFQVDYRTRVPAVLTSVKNQGECASCWAHAATESIESAWAIATGDLQALSQQQLASCTNDTKHCGGSGGCGGGTPQAAFDTLATGTHTVASTWDYPYTSFFGANAKCAMDANTTLGTAVHVDGYRVLSENNETAVMDALARVGPLAVIVQASTWMAYAGGIFDGCAANVTLDHVVLLVGYGRDAGLRRDYWVVRNSWGPAWGEHGYIRLARDAGRARCGFNDNLANDCRGKVGALQRACGMCGVLFDVSYPTVAPAAPPAATVKMMGKLNPYATTCAGATVNHTVALGECVGVDVANWFTLSTSNWLVVSAVPKWFVQLAVYPAAGCTVPPGYDVFPSFVECDVPQMGGQLVTGCSAGAVVVHGGCDAHGHNCTSTTPVSVGQCARVDASGSLLLSRVVRTKRVTQSTWFHKTDCSGEPASVTTAPCGYCTGAGTFVCS